MTLKCPRTSAPLKEINVDGIKVDISEKCGGVWFDIYELKKVDEANESAGEKLIEILKAFEVKNIDLTPRIKCLKCLDVVMYRHFYSPHKTFQIDTCPACGGVWLDPTELAQLKGIFKTEKEKIAFANEFAKKLATEQLGTNPSQSKLEADVKDKTALFEKMLKIMG